MSNLLVGIIIGFSIALTIGFTQSDCEDLGFRNYGSIVHDDPYKFEDISDTAAWCFKYYDYQIMEFPVDEKN